MNKYLSRNLLASSILATMFASHAYARANSSSALPNDAQASEEQVPASASTSRTPASKHKAVQLQTVMVTAQRREEEVQKIPMGITTLDSVQLARRQVKNLGGIVFDVPNIVLAPTSGVSASAVIYMRGIGQDNSIFTVDPGIALYIDDVYIPRINAAMLDLYDVERIEVLRGPQGTLYGRNATGGAIRYITRKPDGKDKLDIDVSLGNYGRRDVRIDFGTKIGNVDVSGGIMSRYVDGYMHDLTHDRMVNGHNINGARVKLATALTDTTYATLSLDYLRDTSGPVFASPAKLNAKGQAVPVLGSFYDTETNILGNAGMWQYGVALTTDTDFGSFTLRNILHTRGMNAMLFEDFDGTERLGFQQFQDQKQRQYGYEAQLISQIDGPFSWVGGFFSFRETNSVPLRTDILATGPTSYLSQQTNAYALYWQGTYKFTDRLSLIGGTRYSWEKRRFLAVWIYPDGTPDFTADRSKIWTHPDWKVALNYDFTKNIMGYVSATTGFKSGAFNGSGSSVALTAPVDAEKVLSYELGVKSSLFNDRVTLNIDYYRNDYSALQVTGILNNGLTSLTNATGALIQGVELDTQIQLTQQWRASAGFGTIDARYRDFNEANSHLFAGIKLKKSPKFQWNLSSTYIQSMASADLVWTMQLKYTDSYYGAQNNNHFSITPTHLDAQARIAYEPRDRNWTVALWGQNLTNNDAAVSGLGIGKIANVVYPSMPRTYGMEFTYRFF